MPQFKSFQFTYHSPRPQDMRDWCDQQKLNCWIKPVDWNRWSVTANFSGKQLTMFLLRWSDQILDSNTAKGKEF
jgi:hypothetical protein